MEDLKSPRFFRDKLISIILMQFRLPSARCSRVEGYFQVVIELSRHSLISRAQPRRFLEKRVPSSWADDYNENRRQTWSRLSKVILHDSQPDKVVLIAETRWST